MIKDNKIEELAALADSVALPVKVSAHRVVAAIFGPGNGHVATLSPTDVGMAYANLFVAAANAALPLIDRLQAAEARVTELESRLSTLEA